MSSASPRMALAGTVRKDAVAGLINAVVSVPDGLASAALAGVNPVYGLYTSVAAPIAGSSDIKATFGQLAEDARRLTRAPLAALYLLESVPAGTINEPIERQRIEGPAAVFGLLGQTKIGALLGGSEAPTVFASVVALAEGSEVYRLRVTRDYERLGTVVDRIMGWHGGVGARASTLEGSTA